MGSQSCRDTRSGVRKPLYFTLPKSFEPLDYLKTLKLQMRADDARWFIDTIVRKTANRIVDDKGCVRLDSQILKSVMHKHTYAEVIGSLEDGGVVESLSYSVKNKMTGYRLSMKFLSEQHKRVLATDPRLIERAFASLENPRHYSDQQQNLDPIHVALNAEQQRLSISDEADEVLQTINPKAILCQDCLIGNIRRKDFPFTVSSTGRVFNAITGLKKVLRKTVRLDGKPIASVDLRCAQPAFLALLIEQTAAAAGQKQSLRGVRCRGRGEPGAGRGEREGEQPRNRNLICIPIVPYLGGEFCQETAMSEDFKTYKSLVCSGEFYPELARITGMDIGYVKHDFIVDVLAKNVVKCGDYPSPVESAFAGAFPSVFRVIKKARESELSVIGLLQKMESSMVIHGVCKKLIGSVPCVTVHDEVYSTCDCICDVEKAFYSTFDDIGFSMAVKRS